MRASPQTPGVFRFGVSVKGCCWELQSVVLLYEKQAVYYGPDWPGITTLLAGENGYMH